MADKTLACIIYSILEVGMAQLKRAKDGHFYIRAGPSQGTWQISAEGLAWLRQYYHMPEQDENVALRPGTFPYLKNESYIFINDIPYDHSQHNGSFNSLPEHVDEGFPLLLRLKEYKQANWE